LVSVCSNRVNVNINSPPEGVSVNINPQSKVNKIKKNKIKKEKTVVIFKPPTVEEVSAYCTERKNTVDANRFIDFYTSKGWMVGKNKMKDWHAAVRTWENGSNFTGRSANQPETYTLKTNIPDEINI
jgi:hypothetical protein